ncbi:MAG: hypothetical protein LBT21_03590 [Oscillospiraceae bacterium]|jgi:hypothetical protein|nr:hypothetical protein [Oscillospiraceae bacterium]
MDKHKDTTKSRESELEKITKAKPKKRKVSRKKGGSERIIPIIEKVIAVVLALALISGIGYTIISQTGIVQKISKVATVGDERLTVLLYNYAYRQNFGNLFSQYAQYYQYLGASAGYDITKLPSEQEYTAGEDQIAEFPEAATWETWADVLEFQTIKSMQRSLALYLTALETEGNQEATSIVTAPVSTVAPTTNEYGATSPSVATPSSVQTIVSPYSSLTDEERAEIDSQIEESRTSNAAQNTALNAALAQQYGHGFTEKVLRNQLALEILATRLSQGKLEEFKKIYTDAKCTELYNADLVKYGMLDYRVFTKTADVPVQKEGEKDEDYAARKLAAIEKNKKAAKAIVKKINDEDTYLAQAKIQGKAQAADASTYEFSAADTLNARSAGTDLNKVTEKTDEEVAADTNFQSAAAKWAFSKDRKAGNVGLYFGADGTATFIYIVRPSYAFVPVSVREIVLAPVSTSESDTAAVYTDTEIAAAKKKAQDVLAAYKKGKKTAESFGELAVGNSSGETAADGGVVAIDSASTQDAAYLSWAFNPARKAGDTTILTIDNTSYVLYFEAKEKATYFETIASEKSQEDYTKYEDELLAQDRFKLNIKYSAARKATKVNENWIRKILPNYLEQVLGTS